MFCPVVSWIYYLHVDTESQEDKIKVFSQNKKEEKARGQQLNLKIVNFKDERKRKAIMWKLNDKHVLSQDDLRQWGLKHCEGVTNNVNDFIKEEQWIPHD